MLGLIIGNIAGSESGKQTKDRNNSILLDERNYLTSSGLMAIAAAAGIIDSCPDYPLQHQIHSAVLERTSRQWIYQIFAAHYPLAGREFMKRVCIWISKGEITGKSDAEMAVLTAPCAFAAENFAEALRMADAVCMAASGNALKGTEIPAVLKAVCLARQKMPLQDIRMETEKLCPMNFTLKDLHGKTAADPDVPSAAAIALEAFFESNSFEDVVCRAVSHGGNRQLSGAIAGSLAEAYYGVPEELHRKALLYLDDIQKEILRAFEQRYGDRHALRSRRTVPISSMEEYR